VAKQLFNIPQLGPNGSARVCAHAFKYAGSWTLYEVIVKIKETGQNKSGCFRMKIMLQKLLAKGRGVNGR